MLQRFKNNLSTKTWFQEQHRVLLAISGGIDSVVMAHLFSRAKFSFAIAHCNFQLRGQDSDEDAVFVRKMADQLSVPFFYTAFETQKLAAAHQQSIQMEARDLRYGWLEKIRKENGFHWIATAHHLNDSIETVLYNFAKGTGIQGLTGIPERNGHIIRPLLFATKKELIAYTKRNGLTYREDASNAEEKYARNKIRHSIIPVLETLNPRFVETAGENILRLQDTAVLMQAAIQSFKTQFVRKEDEVVRIQINGLGELPALPTVLYEWLRPFGFNATQIAQLLEKDQAQVGRTFRSPTHELLVDRNYYLIKPLDPAFNEQEHFLLEWEQPHCQVTDGKFLQEKRSTIPDAFPEDENVAFLHLDQSHFPLTIRHWQEGDVFQPLGMQGKHQKVQDFFTNQKVTRFDKSRIWIVVTNQQEICWIVGHRIDERFKLVSGNEHFIVLSFIQSEGQP